MNVTRQDFVKYEKLRNSGKTNMMDIKFVQVSTGLSRETIFAIMKDYSFFKDLHGGKENEPKNRNTR